MFLEWIEFPFSFNSISCLLSSRTIIDDLESSDTETDKKKNYISIFDFITFSSVLFEQVVSNLNDRKDSREGQNYVCGSRMREDMETDQKDECSGVRERPALLHHLSSIVYRIEERGY
jgi:hypothetical protein